MKTYILPLLFTSLLFANPLDTTKEIVPLNEPFTLDAKAPMFDDNLSYTHKPLLSCQPTMDAVYKIESATKLKIIPKTSLQSDTHYTCDYKEDNFTFKTETLKVISADFFKAEKILRLSFNDKIDLDALSENLELTKVDKLSKTKLHYSVVGHDEQNVVLKINESIKNAALVLNISKELKLKEDFRAKFNSKSAKKVTLDKKTKPMTMADAPQMVALETGGFAIRLFSEDGLEGNSKQSIEIEGIENITLGQDKYINYNIRNKYNISRKAYYYTDIVSSEFQPNKSYKLTLKKGLKNYNKELKADKSYTLKSADRAKNIRFDEEKQYISNVGELGFSSVNIESATLIVERLLDNNLRYFMNFQHANKNMIEGYTKELLSKKISLDNRKNEIIKQKISLQELSKELPFGVYKITLRYDEVVNEEIKERYSSKVLFLSDLGISLNLAKEQAFVSILSLSSAQPIADAKVELYAANNDLIATALSNKDGIAIIEKKLLLQAKPKGIVVSTTKDKNFLALNKSINSPMPEDILKNEERFKSHIYFQSNILRPASEINAFRIYQRQDRWDHPMTQILIGYQHSVYKEDLLQQAETLNRRPHYIQFFLHKSPPRFV